MRRSTTRRALAAGAAVCAVYVAVGWMQGSANPLLGRPVYDGLTPPAAYRWVDPPPELAPTNIAPEPGMFRLVFEGEESSPAVFSTPDLQFSSTYSRGAVPAVPGQEEVAVTVTPLAPEEEQVFEGLQIRGNVYRVEARYIPGMEAVGPFVNPGQLALVYPAEATILPVSHQIVSSQDGVEWLPMESLDSAAAHRVVGDLTGPGFFAVAGPPVAGERLGVGARTAIVLGAVAAALALAAFQWRRARRSGYRWFTEPGPRRAKA